MESDVNLAELSSLLGKSKMVMDATKVNVPGGGNNPSINEPTGGYSSGGDGMQEKPLPDMNEMLAAKGIKTNVQVPEYDENLMYEEAVAKSKLPPHIKKLMAEQRIEQATPGGAPVPESAMAAMNKQTQKKAPIQERVQAPQQTQQMTNGVSKEDLKSAIREVLSDMMMESISETAVKRTLKKMMTEGKLKVKK